MSKMKRIIVAVDLKAQDLKLTERLWAALAPLVKNKKCKIEPVCILNREDAAIGKVLKGQIGNLKLATETNLKNQLASRGLKDFSDPVVIFADGSSTQRAVMALLKYAKDSNCDLIAVSSNSRSGVKRFFLGSFAETLTLQSKIPLLVVNPSIQSKATKLERILFPTDFSASSKKALSQLCGSLGDTKTKILLYHKVNYPMPVALAPFAAMSLPESVFDEEVKRVETLGYAWAVELRGKGYPCEAVIDEKGGFATERILKTAKVKNVQIIAMGATTGKLGAILLGSITRQVLREATLPVWVIHEG